MEKSFEIGDLVKVTAGEWQGFIGFLEGHRLLKMPEEHSDVSNHLLTNQRIGFLREIRKTGQSFELSSNEKETLFKAVLQLERGEVLPDEQLFFALELADINDILNYESRLVGAEGCRVLGHEWLDTIMAGDRNRGRAVCRRCGRERFPKVAP